MYYIILTVNIDNDFVTKLRKLLIFESANHQYNCIPETFSAPNHSIQKCVKNYLGVRYITPCHARNTGQL